MIRVLIYTPKHRGESKQQLLRNITDALHEASIEGYHVGNTPSEIHIDFWEKWAFLSFIIRLMDKKIPFSVQQRQPILHLI